MTCTDLTATTASSRLLSGQLASLCSGRCRCDSAVVLAVVCFLTIVMPFINNPLPTSLTSEAKKCAKILSSFVDPRQAFGPDKIIPPQILSNARGLAVLSVVKAGFLGSGRFGSGVVVARLPDGSWSPPSAIVTGGAGFGGQIGFEFTDFVFILNDVSAVKTFAQAGSLTLGGNVSLAAGPVGRNAEAAGAASLKSVAGIFSYSKTKGLFAGVSLEGSAIIERKEANAKFYGRDWTAQHLLSGQADIDPVRLSGADPLMRVLNSRVFTGSMSSPSGTVYNDIPVYDDSHEDVFWQGRRGSAYGEGRPGRTSTMGPAQNDFVPQDRPSRASTWADDVYDRQPNAGVRHSRTGSGFGDDVNSLGMPKPHRPTAPKPVFGAKKTGLGPDQAVAKFTFEPDQQGDLGFKKGDIITIVKRTDNDTDWWKGKIGGREGIFPRYALRSPLMAPLTSRQQLRRDCVSSFRFLRQPLGTWSVELATAVVFLAFVTMAMSLFWELSRFPSFGLRWHGRAFLRLVVGGCLVTRSVTVGLAKPRITPCYHTIVSRSTRKSVTSNDPVTGRWRDVRLGLTVFRRIHSHLCPAHLQPYPPPSRHVRVSANHFLEQKLSWLLGLRRSLVASRRSPPVGRSRRPTKVARARSSFSAAARLTARSRPNLLLQRAGEENRLRASFARGL